MLSMREQQFLNRLQKKYRKKIFELVSDGETQSLLIDGEELNFAWFPPLDIFSDSCNGATEVLFNDCVVAIKESIAAERKHKREFKKAYIKQNK